MSFQYFAGAAYRTLTARKNGPSLYDVCDPVLRRPSGGDPHIAKFYRTALGNPALRALLHRAGLPELNEPARLEALREALTRARDDESPDWAAIGEPVAALIDSFELRHPQPPRNVRRALLPPASAIDRIIRACGGHLLGSFATNGFIPTFAAFNLIGDPDLRGREFLMALTGLNSRGYKNSTLLFNLARAFIARSQGASAIINPSWHGIAEPMWAPVQIRHRSAYYDAFFTEALLAFVGSGLASPDQASAARGAIAAMVDFCLNTSRETVRGADGANYNVVTALAPLPHPRFSRFFAQIKQDLGFGIYVPDCDTTACAFSAATQAGSDDPMLNQPLVDFYAGYQVRAGGNEPRVTVPINDIDYEGGIATWIDSIKGERPFGNDLDPTLNLDVLEVAFRNLARWQILETSRRLATIRQIVAFQQRLVVSGAFTDPRSHIYYLPELYCAYFGRCYAAFIVLPAAARRAIDPDGAFEIIRSHVLAYVQDELIVREMNVFDAALALIALGHLGAERAAFVPALHCIVARFGEGKRAPYRAYEWNKMKTPTRILVGGPEVTSAFVLMGLVLARRAMAR